jgi:Meiotically up-regulated gene 113
MQAQKQIYIAFAKPDLVKIGCSINPDKRVAYVHSECPVKLKVGELRVIATADGDWNREQEIHKALRPFHIPGALEWYRLTDAFLAALPAAGVILPPQAWSDPPARPKEPAHGFVLTTMWLKSNPEERFPCKLIW